jgi:CBS domain-containing protein
MSIDIGRLDLYALFRETQVRDLPLPSVPALSPDDTVSDAADAMRCVSHGSAVVCEGGKLVGIITERDLLRIAAAGEDQLDAPLGQVMTRRPRTVSGDDALCDAVRWMDEGGCRRLPVVDEQGRPTGVLDVKTVVDFVVEHMPRTVYNQAPTQSLTVSKREGA